MYLGHTPASLFTTCSTISKDYIAWYKWVWEHGLDRPWFQLRKTRRKDDIAKLMRQDPSIPADVKDKINTTKPYNG